MSGFFATAANAFDAVLITGMTTVISGGLAFANLYVATAMSLYILGYALLMIWGKGDINTWGWAIIRAVVLVSLLAATNYQYYVEQLFFTDIPNGVAKYLSGISISLNSAAQFDTLWSAMLNAVSLVNAASSGPFGIADRIVAWLLAGISLLALGLSFLVWYMSRVFMAIVIGIGPFLLISFMFQSTRSYGQSWVGKLVGLSVLQIASSVLLRMVLQVVTGQMLTMQPQLTGSPDIMIGVVGGMCALFWFGAVLMVCLPASIAIGSGVGVGAAMATSRITSLAKSVASLPFKFV